MKEKKTPQLDWLGRPIRANARTFKAGQQPRAAKTTTKRIKRIVKKVV